MRIHKKKHAILLFAALPLLVCLLAGSAVNAVRSERPAEGVSVLTGVDPELLTAQIDGEIDFMNSPEVFWKATRQSVTVTAPDTLPFPSGRVFEGSRSLLVTDEAYGENSEISLMQSYADDALLDFTQSRYFTFSLFLPEDSAAEVTLSISSSIILVGQSESHLTYEQSVSLSQSGWHTLIFDISTFLGRSSIRQIEITVTPHRAADQSTFSFALDAVGFSSARSLESALKFLSDSFLATNCILTYGDRLTVSALGNNAGFAVSDLSALTVNGETALCVALINQAGFRSLRMEATDSVTLQTESITQSLESTADIQYVYFPIKTKALGGVAFFLEGSSRGEISILSISPVSFMVSESAVLGTLSGCRLDQTRKHLEISGSLNSGVAAQYSAGELRLYELGMYQNLSDLINGKCRFVTSQAVSEQFVFDVTVTSESDTLSRGWAVVLLKDGQLMPISEPIYLQNPEMLSGEAHTLPDTDSKKGYAQLTDTDIFDGIAYTTIPVRLEQLLTMDRTALSHDTDGVRYYYREDTLEELDKAIAICKDRGIRATLILTVSSSEDAALNRILLHPQAEENAVYCAFNTTSADGIRYLRAAIDLLARRYEIRSGDRGGVFGFAVGANVNSTKSCYSMGDTTLYQFVSQYAAALRLIHNTVAAINPHISVYASLDSRWSGDQARGYADAFGTRQVLDLLNYMITTCGDFGWQIAYDPYPNAEYYAFEDKSPDTTPEADRVTISNLEVLTAYITRTPFYYDRQYRSILLVEHSGKEEASFDQDAGTVIKRSADYVYGYYKISTRNFPLVTALVVNHDVSYNDTLCYIDTEHSQATTAYALEVLGIRDWSAYLTAFDPSAVVIRSLTKSILTHATPSSAVGELVLWDFEKRGPTGGWQPGSGVSSVSPGTSVGGDYFLSVQIDEAPKSDAFREIVVHPTSPYDFTLTPYLRFACNVSGLPEDVSTLELTVAVFSGDDCLRSEAQIAAGTMTTVVVDMKDFSGISKVDCIRILLRGVEEKSIGSPTLLIGRIDGLSDRYVDDELKDRFEEAQRPGALTPTEPADPKNRTIVILAAVIVTALTLEILHIVLRRRKAAK